MIAPNWNWQFPRYIGCKEQGVSGELAKAYEEIDEAMSAYEKGDMEEAAIEIMDIIHAAESALHALDIEPIKFNECKQKVIEKNAARGYYLWCQKYDRPCDNTTYCEHMGYECDARYRE